MTKNNTHKTKGSRRTLYSKKTIVASGLVNMDDNPSHWVIETSINALKRLTCTGAVAEMVKLVMVVDYLLKP